MTVSARLFTSHLGLFMVLIGLTTPTAVGQEQVVTVKTAATFQLTPADDEPFLYLESKQYPDQKWRLWIPEIFVVHSDLDRHFGGLRVQWQTNGQRVWFEKEVHESDAMAASLRVEAWPEHRSVQVRVTVKNLGSETWGRLAHPAVCLSSQEADQFHSDKGRRTLVRARRQWISLADLLGGPITRTYNHFWVAPLEDPMDHASRAPIQYGMVLRESIDRAHCLYIVWEKTARVDVNFNHLHCIHSHPLIGALGPGEETTVAGTIRVAPRCSEVLGE